MDNSDYQEAAELIGEIGEEKMRITVATYFSHFFHNKPGFNKETFFEKISSHNRAHWDKILEGEKNKVILSGHTGYHRGGKFIKHSFDDKPCSTKNGETTWYEDGKLHRDNGPALIDERARIREYFTDGVLIRTEHY